MMPKNRRIRLKSNKYILSEFKYFSSDDDDDDDSSSFIMPRMYFKVSDTKSLLPLATFLCSSLFLLRLMERDFINDLVFPVTTFWWKSCSAALVVLSFVFFLFAAASRYCSTSGLLFFNIKNGSIIAASQHCRQITQGVLINSKRN